MSNNSNCMFSIIIPVYNAEKYIETTVKSILNQTYKNFELLLINDGSNDNSKQICEELSKKDSRIRFFDRVNEGASKSRNYGIEKSSFEYICFLDADDYVENNMLQEYVKILEKYKNVEMITCGFFYEILDEKNKKKSQIDTINYTEKYYSTYKELKDDFVTLWDKAILYNVWNKVYLKSIIKKYNITFIQATLGEDVYFNQQYLLKINSLYNTNKCFYHYVRGRSSSITGQYIKNLFDIRLEENVKLKKYFKQFGLKKNRI